MIIDELLISLGFKLDKKSVKDLKTFEEGFKKATANLLKMTAAAVAGATALVAFTKVMSESTDELAKSARRIGIEAQELDALRFAMNLVTGSGDGVNGMLESLSRHISEAARGTGSAVEVFGLLDVEATNSSKGLREVNDVLLDVLKATEKMGDAKRLELLEKLGLGGFALAAKDVKAFTSALQAANELSFITKEDAKLAEDFNDNWVKLFRIVQGFAVLISSSLSPALSDILIASKEWLKVNEKFIREDIAATFATLAEVFSVAAMFLGRMASNALLATKFIGGLNTIVKITLFIFGLMASLSIVNLLRLTGQAVVWLAARFTILNAKMLLVPAIITSLILLIALLADEFATFARGGDTLFTKLFEKFPQFEDTVTSAVANVMITWDKLVALIEDPLNFDKWQDFFDFIKEGLQAIGLAEGGTVEGETGFAAADPAQVARVAAIRAKRGLAPQAAVTGPGQAGTVQKVEVTVNGDATGVDKAALQQAVVKVVDENNRQALRNLETGLNK